jgi:hypothetical protein
MVALCLTTTLVPLSQPRHVCISLHFIMTPRYRIVESVVERIVEWIVG